MVRWFGGSGLQEVPMEGSKLIKTPLGIRCLVRRVGTQGEYYLDTLGQWWVHNPQKGFIATEANHRCLARHLAPTKAT